MIEPLNTTPQPTSETATSPSAIAATAASPIARFRNPLELSGAYNPLTHGRVQVDMPKDDLNFFRSINPVKGMMQTTINILLVKLQTQLKSHGITTVTQCREYCDFLNNIHVTDGRESIVPIGSTPAGPVPKTSARNVRAGKKITPSKNT
jgi:hypothetical protein